MPPPCPSDEVMQGLLEATLPDPSRREVLEHLDSCPGCRGLLAELSTSPLKGGRAAETPADRYVLLSPLGAGGMGVVHSAFDRQLDRKVALKFLSSNPREELAAAQARLQREAQALAKLAHPHVITVHDVGSLDGELFLAMELVEGTTLRSWMREPHSLREVLGIFRQAGEGLAAAHAAGLVHRDFKPENVLVGSDGRVRVTDFGLARSPAKGEAGIADRAAPAELETLTRTGTIAGTPAYMAPEQRQRGEATAQSDIYSFCLTLKEALSGAHPPTFDRPVRRIPSWLQPPLERGLSPDPQRRWVSMEPLLRELAKGPTLTLRRIAAGAAVVGVIAAGGLARSRQSRVCLPDEEAFTGVWDEPSRERVAQAFQTAAPDDASFASESVDRWMTKLRSDWIAMRADACAATHLRHEQTEVVLDLRSSCLDRVRLLAKAQVDLFAHADRDIVSHAPSAVERIAGVDGCANVRALEAVSALPADPVLRARVVAAQQQWSLAFAELWSGKGDLCRQTVEAALASLAGAAGLPVVAQLQVLRARAMRSTRKETNTQQREALNQAAATAIAAHDDASAAEAWTMLFSLDSNLDGRGQEWSSYAEAAIQRLGGDDGLEGERLLVQAQIEEYGGKWEEARAHFEQARPLVVKAHGADFSRIGSIIDGLGTIALFEQKFDDAHRLLREAISFRARTTGPSSGGTLVSRANEEDLLVAEGRWPEAEAALHELEKAIPVTENRRFSSDVNWFWAELLHHEGRWSEALDRDRKYLGEISVALSESDAYLANPLAGIGKDLLGLHRPVEAVDYLNRAIKLRGESVMPEQADALFDLAQALDQSGGDRSASLRSAALARGIVEPLAKAWAGNYRTQLAAIDRWVAEREPAQPAVARTSAR